MKTKTTYITIVTILLVPMLVLHAEGLRVNAEAQVNPGVRTPARSIVQDAVQMRAEVRASSTERIKAIQAEMKTKLEARKAELKPEIETIRKSNQTTKAKRLDDTAQDRVQKHISLIYVKLNQRLNLLSRADSEVTRKIAFLALSTSTSAETIATLKASQLASQTLLAKARIDVEATQVSATAEVSATTTKEIFRSLVKTAETSIKTAGASYKQLAEKIRPLIKRPEVSASTTVRR